MGRRATEHSPRAVGRWQMAVGRWQMAGGRWQMADSQSTNQPINQSTNQPVNQSPNLPIPNHLVTLSSCHLVTLSPCHLVSLPPHSLKARANASARCTGWRFVKWAICCRQLTPLATMSASGSAARTAGKRRSSPMARLIS
ncbi:MAG: hypothetical protein D6790_17700 [Caldilineae bacterium]|nr:MAG: hypothetical protein D6790_17700 [Caldilineae bacterium]